MRRRLCGGGCALPSTRPIGVCGESGPPAGFELPGAGVAADACPSAPGPPFSHDPNSHDPSWAAPLADQAPQARPIQPVVRANAAQPHVITASSRLPSLRCGASWAISSRDPSPAARACAVSPSSPRLPWLRPAAPVVPQTPMALIRSADSVALIQWRSAAQRPSASRAQQRFHHPGRHKPVRMRCRCRPRWLERLPQALRSPGLDLTGPSGEGWLGNASCLVAALELHRAGPARAPAVGCV